MKRLIILATVALLAGCAYTMPNGDKVPREVYRTEAQRDLMTLAVAADREYDNRNPIQPPPAVCTDGSVSTMSGTDLAYCSMAMAAYNAQLQVREMQRKAAQHYATLVMEGQAQERMQKWNLALNNPFTAALAGRLINGKPQSAGSSPRISVRGHTVTSRGSGGGAAGAGGGGSGGAELAGVGGTGGGGGGAETGVNGDMITIINTGDYAQTGGGSASTFAPVLEFAEDMGSTGPIYGEGATDSRSLSDDDTLGFGF